MRLFLSIPNRPARFGALVSVILTCQALATSNMTFQLRLGGDNHHGCPQPFTPGNGNDDQFVTPGSVITWDVAISVSGTQAGGDGGGFPIQGVANFVFDLELHQGTTDGPLVTNALFFSSINNSSGDNLLEPAGFAYSFNLFNMSPARVIDPCPITFNCPGPGPGMTVYGYPNNQSAGKLTNFFAGYPQWSCDGCRPTSGVGLFIMPNGQPGVVPLCEGQIATANLPNGTYVLKVIPGAGNTVLRGDLGDWCSNPDSFATVPDSIAGDAIRFYLLCPPPIKASNPSPANSAINVSISPTLCWTPGVGATSHQIYFGTSNSPQLVVNQKAACFNPGTLLYNTTYYWRIDEVGSCGTTLGDVWHFNTSFPIQCHPLLQPAVIAWRSMRFHNGTCNMYLPIVLNPSNVGPGSASSGGPNSETRQGGIQRIEVDFNMPVSIDPPYMYVTGSDGSRPGVIAMSSTNGDQTYAFDFAPGTVSQGRCYTFDLRDSNGGPIVYDEINFNPLCGDTDCKARVLLGDVNQSGTISNSDVLFAKSRFVCQQCLCDACPPQNPIDARNAMFDTNLSCSITFSDVLQIKAEFNLNHQSDCP